MTETNQNPSAAGPPFLFNNLLASLTDRWQLKKKQNAFKLVPDRAIDEESGSLASELVVKTFIFLI